MWFLMAVEQPVITAFIARMNEPKINLASYGVIYSVAMIIESPIIMLLSAGTALPKGGRTYRRLVLFSHLLIAGLTALHLLIGLTPLYNIILLELIGVPREVAAAGRGGFLALTVWSGAVGYRRLWQGILIRHDRTGIVPVTIAIRLGVTAGLLTIGYSLQRFTGVFTGAVALAAGVVAAAIAAYLFARPVVREQFQDPDRETDPLSWSELIRFYAPLALTTLILLAARPLLSVALARLPKPLESLAVWPVLLSVSFLGRSIAMSFQEVGITLLQSRESYLMLRRFAWALAGIMLVVFVAFGVTPLATIWFRQVSGLSADLVRLSRVPMIVLAVLPSAGALISWQRGLLIGSRMTPVITRSVIVNLIVLGVLIVAFGYLLPLSGVLIAAIVYACSVLAEGAFLGITASKARKSFLSAPAE
jgi:hypothetical protein